MKMTLQEAWAGFVFELHRSGKWDGLSRTERQYFDKTNRIIKKGGLPVLRVARLFEKYAPGAYRLSVSVERLP